MHPLIEHLLRSAPIITDGAWGTQLQAAGLAGGDCPDSWNLSRPDVVEAIARAYVEAGSRIILTNTFRANRVALGSHGLEDKVSEINRAGVQISRRAAAGRAAVFASIGPTGRILIPGEPGEAEMQEAFAEQAEALAAAGADAIVIETMSDPSEALIALSAAGKTGLTVVVSIVFDSGRDNDRTMMGDTPEQVAGRLAAAGVDVIGANCGLGIEDAVPICKRLHAATTLPIWIKPNAGLPELVDGRVTYTTSPWDFAAFVPALRDAGASFIGGCCGTNPDFIRASVEALKTS